jgi:hypothetical protein
MASTVQDGPVTSNTSTVTLIRGVIGDMETLVKQQLKLFQTELKAEGKEMRDGTISMALSLGVILIGGVILGMAIAFVLVEALNLPHWAGFGIIGGGLGSIGAALVLKAWLQFDSLTPPAESTVEGLKENFQWKTKT